MLTELQVGQPAPEFTLQAEGGRTVSLADLRGKRVVLYFYPKDNTPGCTVEACGFRDQFPLLVSQDAVVLGVSRDSLRSHEKFRVKFALPFELLSDPDGRVAAAYGALKQPAPGATSPPGFARQTFVIDADGRLAKIWRQVKADGHAEEVLAFLRGEAA
ncbi:MAG: peroxiredoxin [Chloroflexota bacterium]